MTPKLQVAETLTFPLQAVTETFGILAVRGAGKSNTAAVMAEEMFRCRLPFVVVDPVRAWFGLRSSADGKSPGLPIPIFGGRRGDVPLERGAGHLMADLIVDQRLSCVLDLSDFDSEGCNKTFLLDFARRLYQRNEQPLHLFLEEADDYIPQKPMREEAQLLRAWENIVRRGRNRGLGCTLITQRSASINKNVLTQVQTLIAMRTTGPQDIAAIREWVKYHHQSEEILASLAELKDGDAWVWSPQLLGKTVRVHFRRRETFDSGATPKMGASAQAPATLADIDLAAVKMRMAATIEKAKAEDPRELRRRIAELEWDLKHRKTVVEPAGRPIETIKEQRVEVPVLKDAQIQRLEHLLGRVEAILKRFDTWGKAFQASGEDLRAAAAEVAATVRSKLAPTPAPRHIGPMPAVLARRPEERIRPATGTVTPSGPIPPVGQRILNALAELEQLGARDPAREMVAFLAGYSHLQSKGFVNAMSALRTEGCIAYPDSGTVALSPEGRAHAEPPARPRSAEELQARIIGLLGGASGRILAPLIESYPQPLPREHVAERAGYGHLQSKGFVNAISRLRTLGFVDYPDSGSIVAKPVLFLDQ
jgi:hypothetical protein